MTLNTKILITVLATTTLVIAVIFGASKLIFSASFARLENDNVHQNLERISSALGVQVNSLDTLNHDWAAWDDTYNYVLQPNEDYIKTNATDETLLNAKLNLIIIADQSGQIVFSKGFDLAQGQETPVSQELKDALAAASAMHQTEVEKSTAGILEGPDNPWIISSRPILTSNGDGPVAGTIIMGRQLDSRVLQALSETTHLPLEMDLIGPGQALQDNFTEIAPRLTAADPTATRNLDQNRVAGFILINDVTGAPALVLRTEMPRSIYAQGQTTLDYFLLFLVLLGATFIVTILVLVHRLVVRRLQALNSSVNLIKVSKNFSGRLKVNHDDELSSLTRSINEMLDVIRSSRDSLFRKQQEEENLRLTIESVAEGLMTLDLNGNILQVNDAVLKLLDCRRKEQLLGHPALEFIAPENRPHAENRILTATQNPDGVMVELNLSAPDGRLFPAEAVSAGLKDSSGRVTGLVVSIRDISLRKKAQEELNNLYFEERKLRQALESEMKKRADFFRAVVHELKTPLTPILVSSENILGISTDDTTIRLARNVHIGATRLSARINELLDISRGELGMLQIKCQEMDLARLIRDVAGYTLPLITRNNQNLKVNLPSDLPSVLGDEQRLRQVLTNLLDNAMKYTPSGGEISVSALTENGSLRVEVRDSGRGLDQSEQERVFRPYNRIEEDRQHFSGLGLGLSLCKQLIDLHEGKIWVESRKGEGSTFCFSLPLASERRLTAASMAEPAGAVTGSA